MQKDGCANSVLWVAKELEGNVFACTVIHFDSVIARRVEA
jgi:hypothetical protein